MLNDFFGLLGLGFIVLAWVPGILDTLKTGQPKMRKRFMLLYFLGSLSLGVYSYQLNAIPFVVLNAMAAIVPLIHFYFYVKNHGFRKLFVTTNQL